MKPETEALLLCLASAESKDGAFLLPPEVRATCHLCKGVGLVADGATTATENPVRQCTICQGRGWTPSTDPMVWLVAGGAVGITGLISDDNGLWAAVGRGQLSPPWTSFDLTGAIWKDDPFEAILYALATQVGVPDA